MSKFVLILQVASVLLTSVD